MRSFATMLLSVSLVATPLKTSAEDCSKIKIDCANALKAADEIVKEQDDLIMKYKAHEQSQEKTISELQSELDQSQASLSNSHHDELIWGLIGVIAGGVATAYAVHQWGR